MGRGKIAILVLMVIAQTLASSIQANLRNNLLERVNAGHQTGSYAVRCNYLKPEMFTTDLTTGQTWIDNGFNLNCPVIATGIKCTHKGIKLAWDETSQLWKDGNASTAYVLGCRNA